METTTAISNNPCHYGLIGISCANEVKCKRCIDNFCLRHCNYFCLKHCQCWRLGGPRKSIKARIIKDGKVVSQNETKNMDEQNVGGVVGTEPESTQPTEDTEVAEEAKTE